MYKYETFFSKQYKSIAGVDEAGRGCLAGPVVAACVIFKKNYKNDEIRDSKIISARKREELDKIIKKDAIAYAISYVDSYQIDRINIKKASILAMENAVKKMKVKPDCVLVDAEKILVDKTKIVPIIKGDSKSISIAAASIIAKVYHDKILNNFDKQFPQYNFKKNKGYATKIHLNALKKYGAIEGVHRFSYTPVKLCIK